MLGTLRAGWREIEEWWFDRTHGVTTRGNASFRQRDDAVRSSEVDDGEIYVPARAANGRTAIREALRAAGVRDRRAYTFVDLGSGKGRMLFVAARMGFGRVIGVEFSRSLHAQAVENIARARARSGVRVESVLTDAAAFPFPAEPLVVYLFNPFGAVTMERVLGNLVTAVKEVPRHVVVVLLWPEYGAMVAATPGMRQIAATRRHQVFEMGWEHARGRG